LWNDGELPEHWTVNKLKTKHPSQPFNPDIANCFFRAGLIESWGRGTLKIINECKKAKVNPPDFKYDPPGFLIEFAYPEMNSVKKASIVPAKDISEKVLMVIGENSNVTATEMADKIGVTEITIRRIIKQLREAHKIKRKGSDKTGHWIIIN
jgi:ATP-dependent DNA helicase RecG